MGSGQEQHTSASPANLAVADPPRAGAASSIIDLRQLLAERFPQPHFAALARLPTGLAALDDVTGGGLPKGTITELTSPKLSGGSALVISALLHAACRERYFIALLDGRDSFDPESLGNTRLQSLLWVRCTKAVEAVKAADLLLRDGNFRLIILDLVLNAAEELRKIPQTSWYRLQRLVEPTSAAFLVLTRRSMISSAQWKLVLESDWQLDDLQRGDQLSRLKFEVQRVHGGRVQIAEAG